MKGFAKIAALFLAAALTTGCSVGDTSADRVRESGTVRIALQEDERLRELSQHIADSIGASPEFIVTNMDSALLMVHSGSADAAVGYYSENNDPGLDYSLTVPFFTESVYVVCDAEQFITGSEELSGLRLGAHEAVHRYCVSAIVGLSAEQMLYCTKADEASQMLRGDELDAFVCYEDAAYELISADDSLRCYMLPDIQPERYCAAVLRSNTQLCGEINTAIGEFLAGGN